jgi:hypothetical protein
MENYEIDADLRALTLEMLKAVDELEKWATKYAIAHRDFKRESAKAFLEAVTVVKTVAEREAVRDLNPKVDEFRFQNYLAEGMMTAALERVRCMRGALSALQTDINRVSQEMEFTRTAPQYEK